MICRVKIYNVYLTVNLLTYYKGNSPLFGWGIPNGTLKIPKIGKFPISSNTGGDMGCLTGNGKMGWMGHTGQCSSFSPLFHFLWAVIDRISLRQELRPNYSAEASAEAASVEMSPKQKHTFSPFWTLLQCYLCNFSTFFDKASAKTKKLLQNTYALALTEASAKASDLAV